MAFPVKIIKQNNICILMEVGYTQHYFFASKLESDWTKARHRTPLDWLIVVCKCDGDFYSLSWHNNSLKAEHKCVFIQWDLTSSSHPGDRWPELRSLRAIVNDDLKCHAGWEREKWSEVCWKFCKSALGLILYGDSSSNSKRLSIVKHPTQKSQEKIFNNRKLGISLKLLI